jgi:mediator of RNA polymerase II transcription subunit 31
VPPATPRSRGAEADAGCSDAVRFQLELEFVQCLANPRYVNCASPPRSPVAAVCRARVRLTRPFHPPPPTRADLAQNRLLAEPSMVAYLAYLQYWRAPAYARFLAYPGALAMLALLQSPEFRTAMASPDATEHVWRQQFYAWQYGGRGAWGGQAARWAGLPEPAAAAAAAGDAAAAPPPPPEAAQPQPQPQPAGA